MENEIIQKIARSLGEANLGAVIVSSLDNVTYTAGYEVPSQVFPIRERLIFCIITADGKKVMLVPDMEYSLAKEISRLTDVRMYNEFTQHPMTELKGLLEELGLTNQPVAIEDDFLPGVYLSQFYQMMPDSKFVPARKFMSEMRLIKTAIELENLRKVNKIAQKAHYYAAENIHSGMTELQMAQKLSEYLYSNGAESINKLVVGSGERSEHGNANPTSRVIQKGEIVRADIFAKLGGYLSDVARTYVVGKPNKDQEGKWKKIYDAQTMLLNMVKPGAHTKEIFDAFKDYFDKVGLTPINFVGHGLGITLHEDPYISRYHDHILAEGMVLAIEPLYFNHGEGYQLEDIVIVTKEGYELVTDYKNSSELIEISP